MANSWNIDVKVLGCYLRDVATELFALKKALSKDEIDILRFARRTRKLRKRILEGNISFIQSSARYQGGKKYHEIRKNDVEIFG